MSKSTSLYVVIVICYTIAFLGFQWVQGLPLFYIPLALGTLLFIVRIARGDDWVVSLMPGWRTSAYLISFVGNK